MDAGVLHQLVMRHGRMLTSLMILGTFLWLCFLVVLPHLMMIRFSFQPNLIPAEIGGPRDHLTLQNYETLFRNTIHFMIFAKTILYSALVTALCLFISYPIAYHLAKQARPAQTSLLLLLLIIPFWINEILRTLSWFIILSYSGPLNFVLQSLGIISEPVRWLSGSTGVVVGMIYAFVLFMIFPLYNSIETLDSNQIEAARDLGAPLWRIHWRVVIPHAKPGMAVGCIMVFTAAAGSYITPSMLGGPGTRWFTEIIYQWFFEGVNWPQGAAYAIILLVLCIGFVLAMMRLFRVTLMDIAK